MATEQQYRERAKEAREQAEASSDPDNRRLWLEVARVYEHFADLPGRTWHVQKVEPKK